MILRKARLFTLFIFLAIGSLGWSAGGAGPTGSFPLALDAYEPVEADASMWEVIKQRAAEEPFNVVATIIFALAVIHTFMTARIRHWSHVVEERHAAKLKKKIEETDNDEDGVSDEVSFWGQTLHFLGEIEAVFGIWALVLFVAIGLDKGVDTAIHYIGEDVNFNEPIFVVIIMTLASTRPVLKLAERCLRLFAQIGKGTPVAWWLSILILAPLMGSFITEPAAMTIAALLLGSQFYTLNPSTKLKYATIGLLFVNISIGGTLTHFAAPPVLMVAAAWDWDMAYMLTHFGAKAAIGILLATGTYFLLFKKELLSLKAESKSGKQSEEPIPAWVTLVHLLFLGFTVAMAHHPALVIGGFLFFIAFAQATGHHQSKVDLRMPMLVGFFLAGLVIHGGLQGWWIEPVLGSLGRVPLFVGATVLTAFNDNALITYLATLVPEFSDELKLAVVKGAVTGGGLTVIANAPNPAGQSILQRHFEDGVSPLGLLFGAIVPTIIVGAVFLCL